MFIQLRARDGGAYLIWGDSLLAWSPGGYNTARRRPKGQVVSVLTPPSTVAAVRAGYVPQVHPSARSVRWGNRHHSR